MENQSNNSQTVILDTFKRVDTFKDYLEDNSNKIRTYRDTVTSVFTDEILGKSYQNLYYFIDYVFTELQSDLNKHMNNIIMNNPNVSPMNNKEGVYIIFKGGTLMHFMYNEYTSKIPSNIQKDIIETIKDKFKLSDIDYSLYICAQSNERFELFRNISTKIMLRTLQNISENFDNYFKNCDEINQKFASTNCTIDTKYFDNQILKQNLLFVRECIEKEDYNNVHSVPHVAKLLNHLYKDIPFSDLFLLYEYLQLGQLYKFLYKNNTDLLEKYIIPFLDAVCHKIKNINEIKFIKLIKSNFYTKEKIQNIMNNIYETINKDINDNKLKKKVFDRKYEGVNISIVEYEIIKNNIPSKNDVIISQRPIILALSKNNYLKDYSIEQVDILRNHYVSYNNVINKAKNETFLNFDLLRIKFSVTIKNIINKKKNGNLITYNSNFEVPSEFIDVSVPLYTDGQYKKYHHHLASQNYVPHKISIQFNSTISNSTDTVSFYTYSLYDITSDLSYVLSEQNTIELWADPKYEKRIIRIMFFLIYMAHINQNSPMENKINLINCFHFIKLCEYLKASIENNTDIDNRLFVFFLHGVDNENCTPHIEIIGKNLFRLLHEKNILYKFMCKKEFNVIENFISSIITWFLIIKNHYFKIPDFINLIDNKFFIHRETQKTPKNITNKYCELLKYIIDIGKPLLDISFKINNIDSNILKGGFTDVTREKSNPLDFDKSIVQNINEKISIDTDLQNINKKKMNFTNIAKPIIPNINKKSYMTDSNNININVDPLSHMCYNPHLPHIIDYSTLNETLSTRDLIETCEFDDDIDNYDKIINVNTWNNCISNHDTSLHNIDELIKKYSK